MGYEYRIGADDLSEESMQSCLPYLPFYGGREGNCFVYNLSPKRSDQWHDFVVRLDPDCLYIFHQGDPEIAPLLLGSLVQRLLSFNERVVVSEL